MMIQGGKTAILGLLLFCAARGGPAQDRQSPEIGQIRVTTEPSGALVYCNRKEAGSTPLTMEGLAPGTYLVTTTKDGYEEARNTVTLTAGERLTLDVRLTPMLGLVLVTSAPSAAEVSVNGAHRGQTPLLLSDLPLGDYRVTVSKSGFMQRDLDLRLEDRVPRLVKTTLVSDSAILHVSSQPTGSRVSVNGGFKNTTPCTIDRIPGGETVVEIAREGYKTHTETLMLQPGTEVDVTAVLDPLPGSVKVVSLPDGARVYLNDEYRSQTPVTIGNLSPGSYTVRVEQKGYAIQQRTIEIEPADNKVEEFRLTMNAGHLEVTTEPAGVRVFVDGRERGTTQKPESDVERISSPLRVELLPQGARQIRLTKTGFFPKLFSVNIEPGKTVSIHQRLKRRFLPNYEVRTKEEVYKGVLVEIRPSGDIQIEVKPGIIKTIPAKDVQEHGRLSSEP